MAEKTRGRAQKWNRDSCIQAIEDYIKEHQAVPTIYDLQSPLPTAGAFTKYVGQSVAAYCAEHHPELPPNRQRVYTQDAIRAATDAFYAQYHRQAKAVEHRSYNGLPSHNTVMACFHMTAQEYWDTFYPDTEKQWTVERLVEALKRYHADNGRLPNLTNFFKPGSPFPSKAVFHKITDGMDYIDFLDLHLPELTDNGWSQKKAIDAVRQFAAKYGGLPRTIDFLKGNGLPTLKMFYRLFPCQQLREIYAEHLPEYQIKPRRAVERKWDRAAVIQSIRAFVENNQRLPKSHEYGASCGLPSGLTVKRYLDKTPVEVHKELFPEFFSPQLVREQEQGSEPDEEQDLDGGFGGMTMSMGGMTLG